MQDREERTLRCVALVAQNVVFACTILIIRVCGSVLNIRKCPPIATVCTRVYTMWEMPGDWMLKGQRFAVRLEILVMFWRLLHSQRWAGQERYSYNDHLFRWNGPWTCLIWSFRYLDQELLYLSSIFRAIFRAQPNEGPHLASTGDSNPCHQAVRVIVKMGDNPPWVVRAQSLIHSMSFSRVCCNIVHKLWEFANMVNEQMTYKINY